MSPANNHVVNLETDSSPAESQGDRSPGQHIDRHLVRDSEPEDPVRLWPDSRCKETEINTVLSHSIL